MLVKNKKYEETSSIPVIAVPQCGNFDFENLAFKIYQQAKSPLK
jgi:hypothetical protein